MAAAENFAIIGLTGGIASGKSLVAARLVELGAALVDADQLAREVVEPGKPALKDIREAFGDAVFLPFDNFEKDARLDRQAMGEIVFGDPEARRKLEAITHPRIARALMERAGEFRAAGHRWMVYDAALLVENRAHDWLHELIVVAVDPEIQRQRLIARDKLSPAQAQARIDAQMPLSEKLKVADIIIDNSGSRAETLRRVDDIFEKFQLKYGSKAAK